MSASPIQIAICDDEPQARTQIDSMTREILSAEGVSLLTQKEILLPERQFIFCHRTFLVNLSIVQSIRYCELTLNPGRRPPSANTARPRSRKNS